MATSLLQFQFQLQEESKGFPNRVGFCNVQKSHFERVFPHIPAFFTRAFDIGKSNGKRPQYLTTQFYDNANDNFPSLREFIVTYRPCSLKKSNTKTNGKRALRYRKKKVPNLTIILQLPLHRSCAT